MGPRTRRLLFFLYTLLAIAALGFAILSFLSLVGSPLGFVSLTIFKAALYNLVALSGLTLGSVGIGLGLFAIRSWVKNKLFGVSKVFQEVKYAPIAQITSNVEAVIAKITVKTGIIEKLAKEEKAKSQGDQQEESHDKEEEKANSNNSVKDDTKTEQDSTDSKSTDDTTKVWDNAELAKNSLADISRIIESEIVFLVNVRERFVEDFDSAFYNSQYAAELKELTRCDGMLKNTLPAVIKKYNEQLMQVGKMQPSAITFYVKNPRLYANQYILGYVCDLLIRSQFQVIDLSQMTESTEEDVGRLVEGLSKIRQANWNNHPGIRQIILPEKYKQNKKNKAQIEEVEEVNARYQAWYQAADDYIKELKDLVQSLYLAGQSLEEADTNTQQDKINAFYNIYKQLEILAQEKRVFPSALENEKTTAVENFRACRVLLPKEIKDLFKDQELVLQKPKPDASTSTSTPAATLPDTSSKSGWFGGIFSGLFEAAPIPTNKEKTIEDPFGFNKKEAGKYKDLKSQCALILFPKNVSKYGLSVEAYIKKLESFTFEDIKKSYYEYMLTYHPDRINAEIKKLVESLLPENVAKQKMLNEKLQNLAKEMTQVYTKAWEIYQNLKAEEVLKNPRAIAQKFDDLQDILHENFENELQAQKKLRTYQGLGEMKEVCIRMLEPHPYETAEVVVKKEGMLLRVTFQVVEEKYRQRKAFYKDGRENYIKKMVDRLEEAEREEITTQLNTLFNQIEKYVDIAWEGYQKLPKLIETEGIRGILEAEKLGKEINDSFNEYWLIRTGIATCIQQALDYQVKVEQRKKEEALQRLQAAIRREEELERKLALMDQQNKSKNNTNTENLVQETDADSVSIVVPNAASTSSVFSAFSPANGKGSGSSNNVTNNNHIATNEVSFAQQASTNTTDSIVIDTANSGRKNTVFSSFTPANGNGSNSDNNNLNTAAASTIVSTTDTNGNPESVIEGLKYS